MAVQLSEASRQKIDAILKRYPDAKAATLPALHVARSEHGHLSDDVLSAVADYLGLPYAHVYGVVTFYTMFHREETGKTVLRVCTNVSCMLRGAYDIVHHLETKLGIKKGETTKDGRFTLIEEECLAACANAPMMLCGTRYYLDLTREKVDAALAELEKTPIPETIT